MQIAIMIEGQNGLNWPRWQRIARAAEDLGFEGLFRSDHFTNSEPPDLDSLDMWASLAWLASHTSRIEFGPLVSPVSFRHPVITARTARDVDDLSGGRLNLGLGAGWQEREHEHFGFDLLDTSQRFARFREGLEVITRLLGSNGPVNFDGQYYHLHEAILMPRPQRPRGPRIVIGGTGEKYTLPLAARYADEWNGAFIPTARFAELNQRLDQMVAAEGRQLSDVHRSLMTQVVFGRDEAELKRKLKGRDQTELDRRGIIAGTGPAIKEQVERLAQVGAQRVMLQWLDLDDMQGLEGLAKALLP